MSIQLGNLKTTFLARTTKPEAETAVALAATAFSALLLVLTAMFAGPLWRDEVNTINLAQMTTLKEFWDNLPFESFPPLWPLLVRGCGFLGMANSDASIRVLGLYVGLFFLVSLWLCMRWMGGRAPTLSVALIGSLPAFIFIVGANRAYGLASCLLVLSFGMIWRMVERPSRWRALGCGLVCLLFAHCVYYDTIFLCAMLVGAALVVMRRGQWKVLSALVAIGIVSGASMAIYLPIIRQGSLYTSMHQNAAIDGSVLWDKLGDAMMARSSAQHPTYDGVEIWFWIILCLAGLAVALLTPSPRGHEKPGFEVAAAVAARRRADLALYCVVSTALGIVGYGSFLLSLHYLTQTWYYVELLCLCAISLDGILGANWPALRPWGLLRIGLLAAVMTWNAKAAWMEAHTRRSDMDLIAIILGKKATAGDLIVVQDAWNGITFDRYYRGPARWVTVPPVDSHKVHRNDLVQEKLKDLDPMAPVLREMAVALRGGNSIWIVGRMAMGPPKQLPPQPSPENRNWLPFSDYWSAQVMVLLQDHAAEKRVLEMSVDEPVNYLENLPAARFTGYKP